MFMQCSLCIACCVLHTKKHSLYMTLIELCFSCGFGACRHCCYLIMCCPHRHDCCYISVIYCVSQLVLVGTATASYLYCFFMSAGTATYVGTGTAIYCMMWVLLPLHTLCYALRVLPKKCLGTTTTIYIVCYALRVLPHAWILPPLYIVCYALQVLPHVWVLLPLYIVCYALQVLPHVWVLLPLYIVCYALRVSPHAWVYCHRYIRILYIMHCRYCHMRGCCHHLISYAMHCGYCHMRGYCCPYILELGDAINATQYRDTTMHIHSIS